MKIYLLLFFTLIQSLFAQRMFYVSNSGSDSNNGRNKNNAWRTIKKVNSMNFLPGHYLLFEKGGVYFDQKLILSSSGTKSKNITVGSYGDVGYPIIGHENSNFPKSTIEVNADYIIIKDLQIYGTGVSDYNSANAIFINGSNVKIQGCKIIGGKGSVATHNSGIRVPPEKTTAILDNDISGFSKGISGGNPYNVNISNNKIHNIWLENTSRINGGVGIEFWSNSKNSQNKILAWHCNYSVNINNNEIFDCERWGVTIVTISECIVENNEYHSNKNETIYEGGIDHGGFIKAGDYMATNNVAYPGSIRNIIRYNVIHDVKRHQKSKFYRLRDGSTYSSGAGGNLLSLGSALDMLVYGNLLYNCDLRAFNPGYPNNPSNINKNYKLKIYHNTIYNVASWGGYVNEYGLTGGRNGILVLQNSNVEIKNNIIHIDYDGGAGHGIVSLGNNILDIQNNIFVNMDQVTFNSASNVLNGNYAIYSTSREGVTYSNNYFETDVKINLNNFEIMKDSPAINSAVDLGVAYDGEPIVPMGYKGGEPDIGAIEFNENLIDQAENDRLLIYLEANYSNGIMDPKLKKINSLPLDHPYSKNPWNYNENTVLQYDAQNIVDWLLIELRSDLNTVRYIKVALITSNGIVLNSNGTKFSFENINEGKYYLVIRHRNHLDIISSEKVQVDNHQPVNYNFTDNLTKAFGEDAMINLGDGKYGMYGGDSDKNGIINNLDFGAVANTIPSKGYNDCDIDMDNRVTVLDYRIISKNILKRSYVD